MVSDFRLIGSEFIQRMPRVFRKGGLETYLKLVFLNKRTRKKHYLNIKPDEVLDYANFSKEVKTTDGVVMKFSELPYRDIQLVDDALHMFTGTHAEEHEQELYLRRLRWYELESYGGIYSWKRSPNALNEFIKVYLNAEYTIDDFMNRLPESFMSRATRTEKRWVRYGCYTDDRDRVRPLTRAEYHTYCDKFALLRLVVNEHVFKEQNKGA